MNLSIESIQRGACIDAENALRLADEALTISSYSEKFLEIKAEALFLVCFFNVSVFINLSFCCILMAVLNYFTP